MAAVEEEPEAALVEVTEKLEEEEGETDLVPATNGTTSKGEEGMLLTCVISSHLCHVLSHPCHV